MALKMLVRKSNGLLPSDFSAGFWPGFSEGLSAGTAFRTGVKRSDSSRDSIFIVAGEAVGDGVELCLCIVQGGAGGIDSRGGLSVVEFLQLTINLGECFGFVVFQRFSRVVFL